MHRHTEHWINRQKNSMQLNAVAYRGSKQIQDFGMNKFYIITNNEKDKNLEFTDRVVDYLGKRGGHCEVQLAGRQTAGPFHYTDPRRIPEETQCIIVLGGDGTLLQAARDIQAAHDKKRSQIPLLGVNLGNLGFLAEVDRQSVYQALDKLTEDVYEVEERMMLSGTVYRGDRVIGKDIALNDIVIAREGPLRVVRFKNFVNDEYLNSYNADGIIISTPTGSTGYSLSVGGPIVSPSGEMTIMTPIAPHTLNSRSIVFPAEDVITVEDKSDPYVSEMLSIGGFTVKNNLGGVVPYVIVRTNQKEVDPLLGSISETAPSNPEEGDFWYQVDHSAQTVTLMKYSGSAWAAETEYQSLTYTWYAQDKDGHAAEFDKAGKVIYLSAADIDSILTLQCDVSN